MQTAPMWKLYSSCEHHIERIVIDDNVSDSKKDTCAEEMASSGCEDHALAKGYLASSECEKDEEVLKMKQKVVLIAGLLQEFNFE